MLLSSPSRRRGLKFENEVEGYRTLYVVSFSEAWIEIYYYK